MRARRPEDRPKIDPDAAPRSAFVLDAWSGPTRGAWHAHARAQLVHAAEGVIVVSTTRGRWVAPPHRAVWVPGGIRHAVASRRAFRLLTLYVDPRRASLAREPTVVGVDPLIEQLLSAAAGFGSDYPPRGAEARLVRVLLDRLPALAVAPLLHVPDPTTAPLRTIARALADEPGDARTLDAWAREVGVGAKTAARRFVAETGMTFGRWRQQLRVVASLERLGAGESVTAVAFAVGYHDVSSFIAAFKATLGTTPARYFSSR